MAAHTLVEKILGSHAGREVWPGDVVEVLIDARVARDFGGANVVGNLRRHGLTVADPGRTFFTFDCNPTGSDQRYAKNQQACRDYARNYGLRVYDIDAGIGTHVAIDEGLVGPGGTLVSTDSHANILGALGAFGQGMGDVDVAAAFAAGKVWFEVPPSARVVFRGSPSPEATPKDLTLALLREVGASGLLSCAAEVSGEVIDRLDLDGRITLASMATEMGGIVALMEPSETVIAHSRGAGAGFTPIYADEGASYVQTIEVDVEGLGPLISRPGRPDDVVPVSEVAGVPVDSVVIGSCTNGRFADLAAAADLLRGRRVAPGVVLKIVPATDAIWRRALEEGLIAIFKEAGAMVGNAGCAGCAAGQVGQTGVGEVSVSTGNRNFPGKQGAGEIYLASPHTAAASAIAGAITTAATIDSVHPATRPRRATPPSTAVQADLRERPLRFSGSVWVVERDDIDTDMIFHNRHLGITDPAEMGQHTFGNLPGWEDFARRADRGDIVVTGANFGCGSSRQQAVDCFKSLGVRLIVATSFGAIYKRNAINAALPVIEADLVGAGLSDGDEIEVDLESGRIELPGGRTIRTRGLTGVQKEIYLRGGLLSGD